MKVGAVLPGSPADRAGFEKGAHILAVQEVSNGDPSTLVEGADYRASLRITFLQEGAIHRETLVLQSLTELLDNFDGNDRNQLVNAKFVTVR